MSTWITLVIITEYIALACATLYEGQPVKAWYWIGATIVTSAVLLMKE